jgi:hypothetical protein
MRSPLTALVLRRTLRERPRFGLDRNGGPLDSERDFVAELIRETLHRAGHRPYEDEHENGGFAVDGANSDGLDPFTVVDIFDEPEALTRYQATLETAGWLTSLDPVSDEGVLIVHAASGLEDPPRWLARAWRRLSGWGLDVSGI